MKFSQDPISLVTVRKVERGQVLVGNETVKENLVLQRDQVLPGWKIKDVATLGFDDFAPYLGESTEIVLLGTGWDTHLPARELVFAMARRGVGFEFMDTPAACRTFNILVAEDRDVTAFLIVS